MTGRAMDPLPAAVVPAAAETEADGEADLPATGLPMPQDIKHRLVDSSQMQRPQGNPLLLSYSLQELLARDTVQVELIPEKKGLFLKHVEYEVSSQRFKSSVYRRYNDFVVFHEMLLHKFPYRMVPALPPKRMLGADREFIEGRRRALKRFINLVARHPPFSDDVILKLFLSFSGSDVQNKLKEAAQCVGDEFMNCKLAARAKDFLPADIQTQFAMSRELIRNIYNSFYKLRDRAERMASRAIDNASDLLIFGKELSALGSDTTPLPSWAALHLSTWGSLKQALRGLSVEFALLADKAAQQGKQEENDVVEKLNLFLDLLQSYKDLCERHEKGVLHKHQRALHKYGLMKRQMMSAAHGREPETVEQLESRIVEQENVIQTMELRNYFSLYCLHQETQLVHVYLPLTSHILGAFVNSQIQGHKEMSKVWNDLKPKLSCLFAGPHGTLTPPRSPQEDGVCPH
ncbi:sorting nexin-8 isoform X2 [Perognathus longimembris pacificus]|uniref:sorting nexin-8 isoform X2 n=1 Tax=Perognathus longimembris pacificus TaxID=214514 RepID=UPI0020196401|nr:sorting nexin-8 isoform X2 [Perognathus longimembris pacificus]